MAMNQKEKYFLDKMIADVRYWKRQANIVEAEKSNTRWKYNEDNIYLPDGGTIEFSIGNDKYDFTIKDGMIKVLVHSKGIDSNVSIIPYMSNVFFITTQKGK